MIITVQVFSERSKNHANRQMHMREQATQDAGPCMYPSHRSNGLWKPGLLTERTRDTVLRPASRAQRSVRLGA